MKGFFSKLKDFSPKLKVSEILLFSKPQIGEKKPVLDTSYVMSSCVVFSVLLPLAFVLYDIQLKYRPASRDLKRIGSVSLSPVFSLFSDSVHGIDTIRAMKATMRFLRENEDNVEACQKANYASQAGNYACN